VSLERRDRGAGRRVPQPCRLVPGAGENALAVGRESDGEDSTCVSLERRDRGAGRRVPQPRGLVVGAGENALGVGREGDGADKAFVSLEGRDRGAGRRVPQLCRVVPRASENAPAVGREGDGAVTLLCPSSVATAAPVAASHNLAVLSSEPVRTRLPSGEKATAMTEALCPARCVRSPQCEDHLRQALSSACSAESSNGIIRARMLMLFSSGSALRPISMPST
jgi:hypothetical protein